MDIYQAAYNKYAGADWDYVSPSHENYEDIMKNRNAYIFQQMMKNGEVDMFNVEALVKIDATTRKNNR